MWGSEQGAGEVTNYVIVEVSCRVFGKGKAKLLTSFWLSDRRCPRCNGQCECAYVGHGFTMDGHSAPEAVAANGRQRTNQVM